MRIVHLTYTLRGGAGTALRRHHEALRAEGIDSQVIIGEKPATESPFVHRLADLVSVPEKRSRQFKALQEREEKRRASGDVWAGHEAFYLRDTELFRNADILELRQLHAGGHKPFFNVRALRALSREKPIIWRLSDMWAFTGFCAYSLDCDRWREGCGPCPQLTVQQEKAELRKPTADNSATIWNMKQRALRDLPFHMVFPSKWLMSQARESLLKGSESFNYIPVGVDPKVFKRTHRQATRDKLEIPKRNFVIGAVLSNEKNYRKAFDLFAETVKHLRERERTTLLIIGNVGDVSDRPEFDGMQVVCSGFVQNEAEQASLLSAADCFVFPSRCDNSAQVLLEASSCALPVVCFDVGGNSEYVIEGETGRVITPFDTLGFVAAIHAYRDDPKLAVAHGRKARELMGKEYSVNRQLSRFRRLYDRVLKAKN